MKYACTACLKEREIPTSAAWPASCECGGTVWTSAPAMPMKSFDGLGTFDSAHAANALLRQPGSPLDSFRNSGAVSTLT